MQLTDIIFCVVWLGSVIGIWLLILIWGSKYDNT
jgi:hypothetical protein